LVGNKYSREPNHSEILDALAAKPSERQVILQRYIEPDEGENVRRPTKAHHAIAKLVVDGAVCVILTTNFDRLIENGLHEACIEPTVIASEDALAGATPLIHARCIVIMLHGDYFTRIKNTDAKLGGYAPAKRGARQFRASRGRLVGRVGHGTSGWHCDRPRGLMRKALRWPLPDITGMTQSLLLLGARWSHRSQ
jgi:hypothetical protein